MRLGVPREVKVHEYRVGLTPTSVRELAERGHEVVVETAAGTGIGAADALYEKAGARIGDPWSADLIVKVKEPQPGERRRLREGQVLLAYLHLAPDRPQAEDLIRIIQLHDPSTIAAVIVEPVAGSTGVLVPPKGYLERLREICTKHGILLIFDEVMTGFGRTGYDFVSSVLSPAPDIVCLSKGLTGGTLALGATVWLLAVIVDNTVATSSPRTAAGRSRAPRRTWNCAPARSAAWRSDRATSRMTVSGMIAARSMGRTGSPLPVGVDGADGGRRSCERCDRALVGRGSCSAHVLGRRS